MTKSERSCKKCWRALKVYVTCYRCDAIYHPRCLYKLPGFFMNEEGFMFCCGNVPEEKPISQCEAVLEDIEVEENKAEGFMFCCGRVQEEKPISQCEAVLEDIEVEENVVDDNIEVLNEEFHEEKLSQVNSSTNGIQPDLKTHKTKRKEKRYVCPNCIKTYRSQSSLRAHIGAIHLNKTYKCDQCSFVTLWSQNLKTHTLAHHSTGQNVFKCFHCDYTTNIKPQLKIHTYTHMPEKPFKCNYENCNYQVSTAAHLKVHVMRAHTLERPYQCDNCNCKFVRKPELKKHINRKHCKRVI